MSSIAPFSSNGFFAAAAGPSSQPRPDGLDHLTVLVAEVHDDADLSDVKRFLDAGAKVTHYAVFQAILTKKAKILDLLLNYPKPPALDFSLTQIKSASYKNQSALDCAINTDTECARVITLAIPQQEREAPLQQMRAINGNHLLPALHLISAVPTGPQEITLKWLNVGDPVPLSRLGLCTYNGDRESPRFLGPGKEWPPIKTVDLSSDSGERVGRNATVTAKVGLEILHKAGEPPEECRFRMALRQDDSEEGVVINSSGNKPGAVCITIPNELADLVQFVHPCSTSVIEKGRKGPPRKQSVQGESMWSGVGKKSTKFLLGE